VAARQVGQRAAADAAVLTGCPRDPGLAGDELAEASPERGGLVDVEAHSNPVQQRQQVLAQRGHCAALARKPSLPANAAATAGSYEQQQVHPHPMPPQSCMHSRHPIEPTGPADSTGATAAAVKPPQQAGQGL